MALSNLKTKYMTRNDCYTARRKMTPKGIMVHSTATPGVMASDWFDRWNKSYKAGEINRQVCVHAFLDDKEIWQYLPWNHRGWHAGGKANDTHIGFEICEPGGFSYSKNQMVGYDAKKNEAYFRKAWQNAVNLCVLSLQRVWSDRKRYHQPCGRKQKRDCIKSFRCWPLVSKAWGEYGYL